MLASIKRGGVKYDLARGAGRARGRRAARGNLADGSDVLSHLFSDIEMPAVIARAAAPLIIAHACAL